MGKTSRIGPMADNFNNWLFSREELEDTPSRRDGITWENEMAIRQNSCVFILEIGKHLRRGKTDNTAYIRDSAACILFHRFFTAQSFKSHNRLIIGAACIFLAGKIEGCFRHLSEILNIYFKVRGMVRDKESPSKAELQEQQEMVLVAERSILHTLCFDMNIEHHFKPLTTKLQQDLKMYLAEDVRVKVMNSGFCFMRDSFGTVLCLLYPAHMRACGALFLALLQTGVKPQLQHRRSSIGSSDPCAQPGGDEESDSANPISLGKLWYEHFKKDVPEDCLKDICHQIIEVYEPKKWGPKSEVKAAPDIKNLKTQLSSSFGGNNDSNNTNKESHYMAQEQKSVQKIENLVEKNRNNSKQSDFSAPVPSSQSAVAAASGVEEVKPPRLSSCEVNQRPPPTPDFVPPPPLPPPLSTKEAPPPTPDYIPPPPSQPAMNLPKPEPTPEYVPPPPCPPPAAVDKPKGSDMNDLINGLISRSDRNGNAKDFNAATLLITSSATAHSSSKRPFGGSGVDSSAYGYGEGSTPDSSPGLTYYDNKDNSSSQNDLMSSSKRSRLNYDNRDGLIQ